MYSQKESANWYFGDYAGLNFNTDSPKALLNGKLITNEGCATISDPNGNLLFYTDGVTVWDRKHEEMPNGQDLKGHSSSTESALIIPKPGSKTSFYIFTIDQPSYYLKEDSPIEGVNFSEVNLALNGGYGDVVTSVKNKHLMTYNNSDSFEREYKSSEKITAVTHSDGSSIWVTTYFIDKFYSFLVDQNGVNSEPIISVVNQNVKPEFNDAGANITAIGYMKISPNGKKIAIAHSSTTAGNERQGHKRSGKVLLYNFNNTNGVISGQTEILSNAYPYGLEFSPNSQFLYATNSIFDSNDVFDHGDLLQYDTGSSNVAASKLIIKSSQNVAGALQLAIDGKIYRAGYKVFAKGLDLSVINEPNNLGASCNYLENAINLGGRASNLGLPPFVQSIFLYSFEYEETCLGNQTHFFITSEDPYDSIEWNFGDGTTSIQEEAFHQYASPGIYLVSLTLSLNGVKRDPLLKEIIISEPPVVVNDIYDLIQCDVFDGDPSDGFTKFNLEQANQPITLNTTDLIQVYYYQSLSEAIADTSNVKALRNIYRNTSLNEIVYAKVSKSNTACYNIAQVRLVTSTSVDLGEQDFYACDFNNTGLADFDLSVKSEDLIADLNLPANTKISYYESEVDAAIGTNVIKDNLYRSSNKTLYMRAENDAACYGNGILYLRMENFPQLEDKIINVCSFDFPLYIDSGIDAVIANSYTFYWNNSGANTKQILVSSSGEYQVTIENKFSHCKGVVLISVIQSALADIVNIDIDDHDVAIRVEEKLNFLYSLDSAQGPFQESNIFTNVSDGLHEVFVKDIYGCEMTSKTFNVFGFPKFFTPNGDGINDFWNVYGLDENQVALEASLLLEIYDRYGRFIVAFNPLNTTGWDGNYLGKQLSSDDYWYAMKFPDNKIFRGYFTLKR
ncbi:T9SS type B sorting domain-containing protein [Cellulophaga sp. Asnod2-G02]|uniref:T9SS type B sorting domain-containing protein n=1 Tax=Cellulophaga sp. Asnod2-G02 TaxID=3160572 RepID=UPI0038696BB1